jgi:HAD superfamily hydrolase (TIGR01509 family)
VGSGIILVVFDIGGVLVHAGRTLADDIQQAGYTVGQSWLEAFESRLAALPRRSTGAIENARYLPLFVTASNGLFSLEDAQRISDASLRTEYENIGAVLDALENADVATASLSNANDGEWARLFPPSDAREFPTLARLRHRFSSHQLGYVKPDPRTFAAVEAKTAVAGASVLFFDDRIENIAAAREYGWQAELIDHEGDTANQMLRVLQQQGVIAP